MKAAVEYDADEDLLYLRSRRKVHESIEVLEDVILDVDKDGNLAGLEISDASALLKLLGGKVSKRMLADLQKIDVKQKNYKNYVIITFSFSYKGRIVEQQLPPFSTVQFESPLLAAT
jgi:uncharacterized protein YuzE